jgi:hypothetical protein
MARWISAAAVTLLLTVIVAATVSTGHYWAVGAALAGLTVAWLLSKIVRLFRRQPAWGVCLSLLVVGLGLAALPTMVDRERVKGSAEVPVAYSGSGQLEGAALVLHEEIVLDGPAVATPTGWTPSGQSDRTFERSRTITPRGGTPVGLNITIPLDLGSLTVGGSTVPLAVGKGSRVELTLPEGSLGATAPTSGVTQRTADRRQVTSIPIGPGVTDVSVTLLSEMMRHRAAQRLYRVLTSDSLPWVIGILVGLISSSIWDRLLRLVVPPVPLLRPRYVPQYRRRRVPLYKRLFGRQPLVHNVQPHESMLAVVERLRHRGQDLEPQRLPQSYRVRVRLDHGVELHPVVTRPSRPSERVLTQRPTGAPTLVRRVDHEARGGDMGAPARPVRPHLR